MAKRGQNRSQKRRLARSELRQFCGDATRLAICCKQESFVSITGRMAFPQRTPKRGNVANLPLCLPSVPDIYLSIYLCIPHTFEHTCCNAQRCCTALPFVRSIRNSTTYDMIPFSAFFNALQFLFHFFTYCKLLKHITVHCQFTENLIIGNMFVILFSSSESDPCCTTSA